MAETSIEWCDSAWNPVTGCTKVSEGCRNCYAEAIARRFWGARKFGDVQCHEDRLDQPLRWRKPRRIFVNSMSDLFHEAVPWEFINKVWTVMHVTREHQFLVLTKRPQRMLEFFRDRHHSWQASTGPDVPPPNVWLGVSCEDQKTADERIPLLLQTPAAVRWVSCEPLLGPITLRRWVHETDDQGACHCCGHPVRCRHQPGFHRLDWAVVGGESGPRARPCDVAWIRSIRDQCRAAGVACFVKQLGARPILDNTCYQAEIEATYDGFERRLGHAKGGDMSEWPEDLRVREYPKLRAER